MVGFLVCVCVRGCVVGVKEGRVWCFLLFQEGVSAK